MSGGELHTDGLAQLKFVCDGLNVFQQYVYRIDGKFGGNYIWRFGLQPLKLNIGGI